MDKNQEILKLLKTKFKDREKLVQFFVDYLDKMTDEDKNQLYFLLTSNDPKKIAEFRKEKEEELGQLFIDIKSLDAKSRKLFLDHNEDQDKEEEEKNMEKLLDNL
ncbi:hypothetical protein A2335_05040 [Candidatus Peregrinibacteria bacterium RIFOXYB2_FULL_32_7]|nr:MAG: hypothetical protein A2335_05040 [Candidatus Peregrinibacteria bacterium RIFOXYB2_FULL_32_7]